MTDKSTILLLRIIHEDSNINMLRHHNLSFRQIAELVEQNIKEGFLDNTADEVQLTEKGLSLLKENEHKIKERDKSKWIVPDYKNKIRKIDRDEVFLPGQNALSFLK